MCAKCRAIDSEIARMRNIAARIADEATVKAAQDLIAEMEALKGKLHVAER